MQLVIDLIENSISYNLGQIDFMVEGNGVSVFTTNHRQLTVTCLIGLIASIDNVNCYMEYNKEIDKVELRIF